MLQPGQKPLAKRNNITLHKFEYIFGMKLMSKLLSVGPKLLNLKSCLSL